jgi:hypothetical protein
VPCKRRTCLHCRPRHAAARVAGIPEDIQLYVTEISEWEAQRKRLTRCRARGEAGDYLRIGDHALVTDAPIGTPISREAVTTMVEETPPDRGHVSASRAWKAAPYRRDAGDEDQKVDDVRVVRDLDGLARAVHQLGIDPQAVDEFSTSFGITTLEQFEQLADGGRAVPLWAMAEGRARACRRRRCRAERREAA